MTFCVLDGSAALAWVLPGESTAATEALLDSVATDGAVAPAIWPLEIANVLLVAERRGRITSGERRQALTILAELAIELDPVTSQRALGEVSALAGEHGLTVYDAAYLELAVRRRMPLASRDKQLAAAARKNGVTVLATD